MKLKCYQCGYEWKAQYKKPPLTCANPKCRSKYWNDKQTYKPRGKRLKHGMCGTKIYRIWKGIKMRCNNPGATKYSIYGGRGISYCERWENFENFYEDMGDVPFDGATIERIDNDGNYEPSNCKWATIYEQNRNKSSNNKITYSGETMVLIDWAKRLGIHQSRLGRRIKKWGVEKSLSTPVSSKHQHKK